MAQGELACVRVEVEELAVASPVDGDLQPPAGVLFREPPPQQVQEETFPEAAVVGGLEGIADRPDQGTSPRTRRAKICFDSEMSAATKTRPSAVIWRSASSTSASPSTCAASTSGRRASRSEEHT